MELYIFILKVLITIVTIVANLLVILAILLSKCFQKPKHYLILSLSVADFLVGVYVIPYRIILDTRWDIWLYNTTDCRVILPLSVSIFFFDASIFGLILISLDRYVAISYPFFYKVYVTRRRTFIVITITWVISAICASPFWIFADSHRMATFHLKHHYCIAEELSWVRVVNMVILYFTPMVVMVLINVRIWWVLRSRQLGKRNSVHRAVPVVGDVQLNTTRKPTRFMLLWEQKGASMLGVMVGLFLICWLPIVTLILTLYAIELSGVHINLPFWLHDGFKWLGLTNSCVNPFVYTMFSAELRQAIREIAFCRCGTVNSRLRKRQVAKQLFKHGCSANCKNPM